MRSGTGGDSHHDAAEAELFEFEPEVLGGNRTVDVGDRREDDIRAGGDDEHDRGFGSGDGIRAGPGELFNRLALCHDVELPGLLIAR